ncbi:Exopolyphosphatase [Shewanella putrefaciens]|uniref:Exopolyphosphatase n=1 Tax=Shewanella bicestrii TaxID=2018305 RepID=A0A220UMT6_9GAMM|nr:exopolyphosphatase [Shewanella bicestrii]ASK68983.1 exopolyphosphatase [Shewanella bicestrii]VEE60329.1 Exopolyphosphatase [Shewanella putrefaciens]
MVATHSQPRHFVAIDMGSNSFHLVIAREQDGSLQILHKEKQQVQLATGLNAQNILSVDAIERGLNCLRDFNQRFSNLDQAQVRLVATHTLRVAKNREQFIEAALSIMPYPVEVISGHEEARLIYNGIAQSQVLGKRNIVIDIGGGSTEVVLGQKNTPTHLSSLRCGCVSFNERFFIDGQITPASFRGAQSAADKQFASLSKEYFSGDWDLVLGSSGTVKAICEAIQEDHGDEIVTLARLKQLKLKLIKCGHISQVHFANVDDKRTPLVPAGLAILISFFRRLPIEQLEFSPGALREGVLYELAKIGQYQDIRHRTVESIAQLYHVDMPHAAKVRDTAMALFEQVADEWGLRPHARLLSYAATLHEIGLHINSKALHKHGAYIISNSDLPGFSEALQQDLARLIANHRKKPNELLLAELEPGHKLTLIRLACLLRLAVLVHLGRIAKALVLEKIQVVPDGLMLVLPSHKRKISLFMKDLQREQKQMAALGMQLRLVSSLGLNQDKNLEVKDDTLNAVAS